MTNPDWLYRAPSGKLLTREELAEEMLCGVTDRETFDIKIAEMQRIITAGFALASYPDDPT